MQEVMDMISNFTVSIAIHCHVYLYFHLHLKMFHHSFIQKDIRCLSPFTCIIIRMKEHPTFIFAQSFNNLSILFSITMADNSDFKKLPTFQ